MNEKQKYKPLPTTPKAAPTLKPAKLKMAANAEKTSEASASNEIRKNSGYNCC